MLRSHELLLKFRHDERFAFPKVRIWYADRGAPSDCSCAGGADIRDLEAYYFEVTTATGVKSIPYHRIRLIRYGGIPVWRRGQAG